MCVGGGEGCGDHGRGNQYSWFRKLSEQAINDGAVHAVKPSERGWGGA